MENDSMRNDEQLRRGSGEKLIEEDGGRNPTQQRLDEEGPDPRPVDAEQSGIGKADDDIGDVIAD